MDMWATTVLPLKPHPVVTAAKHVTVEGLDELRNAFKEEPISQCRVVAQGLGATADGVRVIWTHETS
jgi:hypothetical protein